MEVVQCSFHLTVHHPMLPPTSRSRPQVDPDEAVRSTDDDAAASRLSAVNLGYLDDPFVSYLYRPKYGESSASGALRNSRKPPLINVGTHHRTYAIDILVDQFLQKGGKQVVSLGAGSDTRFWRLMVSVTWSYQHDGPDYIATNGIDKG